VDESDIRRVILDDKNALHSASSVRSASDLPDVTSHLSYNRYRPPGSPNLNVGQRSC
jgi:hypothetical protein